MKQIRHREISKLSLGEDGGKMFKSDEALLPPSIGSGLQHSFFAIGFFEFHHPFSSNVIESLAFGIFVTAINYLLQMRRFKK
jgi:hypothetical protein